MNIQAFFKLSYGLYIISSGNSTKKSGYVANTAFQVTAEPAQLAISCHKDNYTTRLIKETGVFSVSVLSQDASPELIGLFGYQSSGAVNKFASVTYTEGETGVPIVVQDTLSWFECKVMQTVDVGSHLLFIGEVINADMFNETSDPLTYAYYREVKRGLAPKNAPTYIEKSKFEEKKVETPKTEVIAPTQTPKPKAEGKLHKCVVCGYIYNEAEGDEAQGVDAGTSFDDLPDDWTCPICSADKDMFEEN